MSFLTAYGTVPYNARRLLVAPEVGLLVITATQINALIPHSFPRVGLRDGELQPCPANSGIRIRGDDGDRHVGSSTIDVSTIDVSTIDVWSLALDDRVDAETLI